MQYFKVNLNTDITYVGGSRAPEARIAERERRHEVRGRRVLPVCFSWDAIGFSLRGSS